MTKEEILRVLKANLEWQHYTDGNDSWDSELKEAVTEAIKILEQQPSDDCVSKKFMYELGATCIATLNKNGKLIALGAIENLPTVTPTQCIAEVRFSKDDLKEICNERIEIECTRGTCKDCKHWKDSDGVYRRGIGAESKCPLNIVRVFDGDFYCAYFKKRGNEDGSN